VRPFSGGRPVASECSPPARARAPRTRPGGTCPAGSSPTSGGGRVRVVQPVGGQVVEAGFEGGPGGVDVVGEPVPQPGDVALHLRVGAVEAGELHGGVDRFLGGGQGPFGVLLPELAKGFGEELLLFQAEGGDQRSAEGREYLFGGASGDGFAGVGVALRGGAGAFPARSRARARAASAATAIRSRRVRSIWVRRRDRRRDCSVAAAARMAVAALAGGGCPSPGGVRAVPGWVPRRAPRRVRCRSGNPPVGCPRRWFRGLGWGGGPVCSIMSRPRAWVTDSGSNPARIACCAIPMTCARRSGTGRCRRRVGAGLLLVGWGVFLADAA
jgi:hypothetical protein